jgi:hypothetical protein
LFDAKVAQIKRKQSVERDPSEQLRHLIDKTNLLHCLQSGAVKAGRLALAVQLERL